jgi:chromosome segregation ATPase
MSFFRNFRKTNSQDGGAIDSDTKAIPTDSGSPDKATNDESPPISTPEEAGTTTTTTIEDSEATAAPVEEIKITVEDEPEEDPERTQLESVVRQRDASISALEKARQEKQQQLAALEGDLEKERLVQMKEALVHKIDVERIKRQTNNAEERLKTLETDMQDKAAIHEYANLIKGVAPKGGVDAQYVVKLQAQLQKAVRKMEVTTEQMKELETKSDEMVDSLSLEITQLVEDRCRTELELRKQMEVLDQKKKDMQVEYEERIRENLKTLQALKAKAASQITIEELEEELEETEAKLLELQHIREKQEKTITQLGKSLSAQEGSV